jgi:hypothetical protein
MVVLERDAANQVVKRGRLALPMTFASPSTNRACAVEYVEESATAFVMQGVDGRSWIFAIDVANVDEPKLLSYARALPGQSIVASGEKSVVTFGRSTGLTRWILNTGGFGTEPK